MILGLAVLALAGLQWREPASALASARQGESAIERVMGVEELLGAARAAEAKGALADADAMLRRVLLMSPGDRRGVEALRRLHEHPNFRLPTDEEGVRAALGQLGPGYHVTETKHFVVISDCDASWRRRREALLERAFNEVMRFASQSGIPAYPPATKLLCVMLEEHEAYEAFGRAHDHVHNHWVAGYYASESNRVVLYNDRTNPGLVEAERQLDDLLGRAGEGRRRARELGGERGEALEARALEIEAFVAGERARLSERVETRSEAKAIHEAAHLIAFNCGIQLRSRRYPFWITEGFATGFETEHPNRSFGPDRACAEREAQFDGVLAEGRLEGLAEFVSRLRASDDADRADAEYAQSYALFRHVARFHRDELAGLLADIAAEPPGEVTPARHLELFERRFGDAAKFERRWVRLEGGS